MFPSVGTLVIQVMATDPDLGVSGEVSFEIPEGLSPVHKLYRIDKDTGAITTAAKLTGKGRAAPYALTVRSIDKGEPQMFSDTEVYITVGDVSSNDGIPRYVDLTLILYKDSKKVSREFRAYCNVNQGNDNKINFSDPI